jgi:uncharacterized protein YxjI
MARPTRPNYRTPSEEDDKSKVDENPFGHSQYLLRKQLIKVFGGTFRIYNPSGDMSLFASMKAFKLKEDIRVYTEEQKIHEVLVIKARSIIDFSAAYDVWDPLTNGKIGVLKRRGLKSLLKDEWVIMNAEDQDIGIITEDSWLLAILRRFITALIPQKFLGEIGGSPVFEFQQHFNPFVLKMDLDYGADVNRVLDRRLGIAAAILLCSIEGRQR